MKNWIIALTVAAVYLLVSVSTNRWEFTWLIWIGYAAYRLFEGRRFDQNRQQPTAGE